MTTAAASASTAISNAAGRTRPLHPELSYFMSCAVSDGAQHAHSGLLKPDDPELDRQP